MNSGRSLTHKLSPAWWRYAVAKASTSTAVATAVSYKPTPPSEKLTPSEPRGLYYRLSALGNRGRSSETLDQYISEGGRARKPELIACVRELRKFGHHNTALEMLSWMDKQDIKLTSRDCSLRLELLGKVKGVAAAETYFATLPTRAKDSRLSYKALLDCYCKEVMEEKALDLFKKMKELDIAANTFNYNILMMMYLKAGKPEKVQQLVEEMKQSKIEMNFYSYNNLINSYSSKDDTEGVERVWQEMLDSNPSFCNWTSCNNLVGHYVKVGLYEKAYSAVKKLESLMTCPTCESYHILISLYASISNRAEVYRVWESLKKAFPVTTNDSYRIMLQALNRLGDMEGLIKCFKEGESNSPTADYRLAKPVMEAYLKQGMVEEALNLYNEYADKSSRPLFGCIWMFVIHFLKIGGVDKSIEFAKAGVCASEEWDWNLTAGITNDLYMHFEGSKDVGAANELFKIMKEVERFKRSAYMILLKTYVAAGETAPEIRKMLEEDKVDVDAKLDELLHKVCPS